MCRDQWEGKAKPSELLRRSTHRGKHAKPFTHSQTSSTQVERMENPPMQAELMKHKQLWVASEIKPITSPDCSKSEGSDSTGLCRVQTFDFELRPIRFSHACKGLNRVRGAVAYFSRGFLDGQVQRLLLLVQPTGGDKNVTGQWENERKFSSTHLGDKQSG